jgi:hypothetical protein
MNELNLKNIINEAKKNILQIILFTIVIFFIGYLNQNLFFIKKSFEEKYQYNYSISLNHQNILESLSKCQDSLFSKDICHHEFFYVDIFKTLDKNYFLYKNFSLLKKIFLKNNLSFESFEVQSINKPNDDLSNNQILDIDIIFSSSSNDKAQIYKKIDILLKEYFDTVNNAFVKHIKNQILSHLIERKSFLKYNIQIYDKIIQNSLLNNKEVNSQIVFIFDNETGYDSVKDTLEKGETYKIELVEIEEVINKIENRIKIFRDIIYFDYPSGELELESTEINNSFNLLTYYYLIFFISIFINLFYLSFRIVLKKKIIN